MNFQLENLKISQSLIVGFYQLLAQRAFSTFAHNPPYRAKTYVFIGVIMPILRMNTNEFEYLILCMPY